MTTQYNEGDRVRLSCGESVLFGTCKAKVDHDGGSSRVMIDIDGDSQTFGGSRTFYLSSWTIERLLPAEPPVATVVRVTHKDGFNKRFIRKRSGWFPIVEDGNTSTTLSDWAGLHRNDDVVIESRP